jgi:hypothetical protein
VPLKGGGGGGAQQLCSTCTKLSYDPQDGLFGQ